MSTTRTFFADEKAAPEMPPVGGASGTGRAAPVPRLCLLIFLALVLPLGIILAVITPLGGVADETAHALRAESLSHGEIFGFRAPVRLPDGSVRMAAGVSADLGIQDAAMVDAPGEWVTNDILRQARAATWRGHRSFAEITPLALYLPVFYAPAAVAIAVTRFLDGGPAAAFIAGRMVNLLVFACLGFLTLSIARRGHAVLLCALALPMEVSLAASLNQDGLLIATCALAIGLLTRDGEDGRSGSAGFQPSWSWIMSGCLLGLVALAKIPYAGLLLILVFPLGWRRDSAMRLAGATLFAAPGLAWAAYAMGHIATPWPPLPPYAPGPLWIGPAGQIFTSPDATAQLHVLLAEPTRILTLTLHSLWAKKAILLEFIGILGFVSLRLPAGLYVLWGLALAAAMVADRRGRPAPTALSWRDQAALAAMLGLIVIAIYMSQYLSWTTVGAPIVIGPTGRYFLPLLPAMVFLLPRLGRPGSADLLLLPVAAAVVASLIVTPLSVLDGFYGP
ncbi:MAG TPA: DUF2142 domain-containing protein [Acidisoma sp.]|jgi:uncharacterized membrane protein|nr:DUF2142 domain-containing protein [Acidisoma sp.]